MTTEEKKLKQCPVDTLVRKVGDDDATLRQPEKMMNEKLQPRPLFADTRVRRCSTNQPNKSGQENKTFSQSEKTVVGNSSTSPVSAAVSKVGEEDTTLSQPEKMMNEKLKPRPLFANIPRWTGSYSRELTKQLGKRGVMHRVLSPRAAKLYKDGMPLSMAARSVGIRNAFTNWREGGSICVTLRAERGKLSISKA